jgi:hypothetical protein
MGKKGKSLNFLLILWVATQYGGYLTQTTADFDLWGYLSFGRLWWEGRGFPYQDVFSYLPTKPVWVYHEWLTGVVLYGTFEGLGPAGIQGLKYALGLATAGLIFLTARRRGGGRGAALVALFLIADPLSAGFPPLRAQAFTYLFFALFLFILEGYRKTGRTWRLRLIVPTLWVWANLHGGFVAGLGLVGLYTLGEALARRPIRPMVGAFIFSLAVTLINPYGLDYWVYLVEALAMARPYIGEWHSVTGAWQHGIYQPNILFFLSLVVAAVLVLIKARSGFSEGLVLSVTAGLGFLQIRHTLFFLICFAVYLPLPLSGWWSSWASRHPRLRAAGVTRVILVLTILVLAADTVYFVYRYRLWDGPFALHPPQRTAMRSSGQFYPQGAVDFLREANLRGNLLPRFEWGEYLIWTLTPRIRVGMDGRYETVYPPGVCLEYFNFLFGRPGWREFLARYPHDLILIDPGAPAAEGLRHQSGWKIIYQDSGSILFTKAD